MNIPNKWLSGLPFQKYFIRIKKIIKPENLDILCYTHVLFEWDQEPNTESYNSQISNSTSFDNLISDVMVNDGKIVGIEN